MNRPEAVPIHPGMSRPLYPNLRAAGQITDQSIECDHCGLWRPVEGALAGSPDQVLKEAVEAAKGALDRAHADGLTIPPQAAVGVAMLDTVAMVLAKQLDTPDES